MGSLGSWGDSDFTCDCGIGDFITDFRAGDIVCRLCGTVVGGHILDDRPARRDESPHFMNDPEPILPETHVFLDTTNLPKRVIVSTDPHTVVREGFKIIDAVAGNIFTPNVVKAAKLVYRDLRQFVKHVPSTTARAFAAGSLYMGCKLEGVPRSEKEIATLCSVESARLTVVCKTFKKHLAKQPYGRMLFVAVQSKDLLNRAIDRLGLDAKLVARVKRTAHDIDAFVTRTKTLTGKTPAGVCGGVVYASLHACCVRVSKTDIGKACNVASSTVEHLANTVIAKMSEKNLRDVQE